MFSMYLLQGLSDDGTMMAIRHTLLALPILFYLATVINAGLLRASSGSHGM